MKSINQINQMINQNKKNINQINEIIKEYKENRSSNQKIKQKTKKFIKNPLFGPKDVQSSANRFQQRIHQNPSITSKNRPQNGPHIRSNSGVPKKT
jgi:methyl-accepting chemotaxis protein